MLALLFKIMFPLDLHKDDNHTLTHHQPVQQHYHPRDILRTGQPDGGAEAGRTAGPLSSTGKKDKATLSGVIWCRKLYGEDGKRRRETVCRGLIIENQT